MTNVNCYTYAPLAQDLRCERSATIHCDAVFDRNGGMAIPKARRVACSPELSSSLEAEHKPFLDEFGDRSCVLGTAELQASLFGLQVQDCVPILSRYVRWNGLVVGGRDNNLLGVLQRRNGEAASCAQLATDFMTQIHASIGAFHKDSATA
jgi:hypothetical protein